MLSATVAALACLCLAHCSAADSHALRAYALSKQNPKELTAILASIEERLRTLDVVSAAQAKQARRLDVIQDKLDRVETALSLKLERAQLAAERLEHRLHMLQTSVLASIKESSAKLEDSQSKIADFAKNLTNNIDTHRILLEKVNGAYADAWHRGLVLESMMREGLSLVNVTRRELADGLRALARRQHDARLSSSDLETSFARRLHDNTYKVDLKMQEILDAQKRFVDSCQRVQQDDPTNVADFLEKVMDSLIDKISETFRELQNIQSAMKSHDTKVMKLLNPGSSSQNDAVCRRLETVFRNASHSIFKEKELEQLTKKFVALTEQADAALQRLELRMGDEKEEGNGDVTAQADRLMFKLKGIRTEQSPSDEFEWKDDDWGFLDDGGGGGGDMMAEDKAILTGMRRGRQATPPARTPHRRHLHKHPYDRGPRHKHPPTST